MDEPSLLAQLEELKAHIDSLDAEDTSKRRLGDLVDEIEAKIESVEDAEHKHRLLQTLRDAVAEFEVSHPQATAIVNKFLVTLGNMGI